MNKERAAASINVSRFMALAKDTISAAASTNTNPLSVDEKVQKVREGIDKAVEWYGMDRHVELGEFWPEFTALLASFGCVVSASVLGSAPTAPLVSVPSTPVTAAASAEEEEAMLAAGGNTEFAETAEVAPPPPAAATASATAPTNRKQRVITQADIEARAKMNSGRRCYLVPDEDAAEAETAVTDPIVYLSKSVLYKESVQKCQEVKTILDDVEINTDNTNTGSEKDASKWTPTSRIDKNGYGTYYRAIEGTPFHSLKVVGEVESNILSTLAVLCELDLYKEWFPMCWQSEEQGRLGDLHRWSQFTVSCPWPVAHRSVFIGGFGCDVVYKKKIVIVANSIDPATDYIPIECNIPTPQSRTVTATLNCGGFVLEPLKGGRTKVSFTMNVDPKLKVVPTSLINWFSGKLIWVLLKNLGSAAKKAEKKGSAYQIRREEQKHLYEYFHQRALQVLPADYL